jgi:hypothetical protein
MGRPKGSKRQLSFRALNRLEITKEEAHAAIEKAIKRMTREQRRAFFAQLEADQKADSTTKR